MCTCTGGWRPATLFPGSSQSPFVLLHFVATYVLPCADAVPHFSQKFDDTCFTKWISPRSSVTGCSNVVIVVRGNNGTVAVIELRCSNRWSISSVSCHFLLKSMFALNTVRRCVRGAQTKVVGRRGAVEPSDPNTPPSESCQRTVALAERHGLSCKLLIFVLIAMVPHPCWGPPLTTVDWDYHCRCQLWDLD